MAPAGILPTSAARQALAGIVPHPKKGIVLVLVCMTLQSCSVWPAAGKARQAHQLLSLCMRLLNQHLKATMVSFASCTCALLPVRSFGVTL